MTDQTDKTDEAPAWQKYCKRVEREECEPDRQVNIVEAFEAMKAGRETIDPDGFPCRLSEPNEFWRKDKDAMSRPFHRTAPIVRDILGTWTIPGGTKTVTEWKPLTMLFATVDGKPSAFGALKDGLAVRRAIWTHGVHIRVDGVDLVTDDTNFVTLGGDHLFVTDWQIVLPEGVGE